MVLTALSGEIRNVDFADALGERYLSYALSTIMSRSLPDVRDGLKPVHRRVLYGMREAGMQPTRPYKKSARIVGDVMGSYHPPGDTAIYDTLVRMAQPFSLRYPLVDGQGNFGNLDDDGAAAMRYTECRLSRMAAELLRDIDADTVDYYPNYDETRKQPVVLPSRFPNLLVNGSSGIAVGMATNIPPHHLGETVDAVVAMIDDPEIDVERLNRHIKGPDFPTGAIILGRSGIRDAYRSGRGRIVVRARAHIEELRGGKTAIVITELPYGVKKGGDAGVIKKIADLYGDKVLPEISDVVDHSDKSGMRIQVELKREAVPQVVLNKLFKHTALQTTFGYNAVALVEGVPRTLPLREMLQYYLDYQREVVTRRLKYELRQAEKRAHVLQGYLIALDNIDEVIALIRGAADADAAREGLIERFSLTEIQALVGDSFATVQGGRFATALYHRGYGASTRICLDEVSAFAIDMFHNHQHYSDQLQAKAATYLITRLCHAGGASTPGEPVVTQLYYLRYADGAGHPNVALVVADKVRSVYSAIAHRPAPQF